MITLSVCIISKNEEKNIGRCLRSISNIADEIIIVDTGSTDKTIDIAKNFNAKIIKSNWNNDFSNARNLALDNAIMDYILYIDCDEELDTSNGMLLKKSLGTKDNIECYCINLINIVNGKKNMSIQSLRIFKNRPEFRFKGKIHEQIFPSICEIYGDDCVELLDKINLYHYGYDINKADIQKKIQRNLSIFREYDENEKDGFYYYNLGNEYLRLNDLEAAIKNYIKAFNIPSFDNGFRIFLSIYLVKSLFDLKRYKEALYYADKFITEYEYFSDLIFLKAICYYEIGKFSNTKASILQYLASKDKVVGYPEFKFDASTDIIAFLKELSTKSIDTKGNALTTIIIIDKDSPHLEQTIKSVNELSKEIILVYDDNKTFGVKELQHYLVKIYNYNKKGLSKTLNVLLKRITTPWVLILKSGESLGLNEAKLISKDINSNSSVGFYVPIINSSTSKIKTTEFRLFKGSEYKKYSSLNKFEDSISLQKSINTSSGCIIES
ncbi:Glycosyltransferase involved in cell wall bisynthesis [Clostridium cavendishii DSM 21758]|uniref:Glycosyltransferase involved in cell wall bisynthesis n=1 Tax=Clostridium cavendishii DSM 21758 TaxID=1121302 RepID=A0A1M6J346_9CLOT|nr:glycosyltransferase [Clostridium cavendishii]SHJ41133.1 Glycosyltransferase involved in cell wall bisynthesis [Clostridium cavendishii DSM 21758]